MKMKNGLGSIITDLISFNTFSRLRMDYFINRRIVLAKLFSSSSKRL